MDLFWEFKTPSKIIFGRNSVRSLGKEIKNFNESKALIVTDKIIIETGIFKIVEKILNENKTGYVIFDQVSGEPTDDFVNNGLQSYKENNCSSIIALGGGSAIDTAKAISAMISNPGKIADYKGIGKISKKGAPLIAIPTTAGTGSEVTPYTIITDTKTSVKMLIGSEHIIPTIAIVDPTLTLSCPKMLTAAVGIDALTHAIEAYVSVKANPPSDIFAKSAISRIIKNLLKAWKNGNDLQAREEVMLGSLEAGIAFGNSSVALVHGMSRPIGANFHIAHGMSNAVLLSVVMEYSYQANIPRYADIAAFMGENTINIDKDKSAGMAVDSVKKLVKELQIPSLKDFGIEKDGLIKIAPSMAQAAIDSGSPANNPKVPTKEEIIELYIKAY